MPRKGMLIIVSGPSGVGKGTICAELRARNPQIHESISMTTRERRNGETEGVDYFYVSEDRFNQMVTGGELLEHAYVHGHQYGTPLAYVVEQLDKGFDVLLEIDVQGSIQAMKAYPDAVTIFILPPNRDELRNRLIKRATETPEAISLRLRNAELELFMTKEYQYAVLNDEVDKAVSKVEAILTAERCKVSRGAQAEMND